jgi:hypothetical protein
MRRVLTVLAALAVAAGGLALLLGVFDGTEKATTDVAPAPGRTVPAQTGALGQTLRLGNVVLAYRDRGDARAVRAFAVAAAGDPTPALVAAGQAVIPRRQAQPTRYAAIAFGHAIASASLRDPALAAFVDRWLGEPAGG